MLDIGWTELLLLALVMIIVVGPKDLPRVLRTAGKWMAKARGLSREFQRSIDDMVRDTELDDMRKDLNSITPANLEKAAEKAVDPTGTAVGAVETDYSGDQVDSAVNQEIQRPSLVPDDAPVEGDSAPDAKPEAAAATEAEAVAASEPATKPAPPKDEAGPGRAAEA